MNALVIIIMAIIVISFYIWTSKKKAAGTDSLSDFDNRMKSLGFTKRIVAYDFLSDSSKNSVFIPK